MKRIPKEDCGNLVKSMPRRIEGVIKPQGGKTRCLQKNDSSSLLGCKIYVKS
jgi:hypothetical protein